MYCVFLVIVYQLVTGTQYHVLVGLLINNNHHQQSECLHHVCLSLGACCTMDKHPCKTSVYPLSDSCFLTACYPCLFIRYALASVQWGNEACLVIYKYNNIMDNFICNSKIVFSHVHLFTYNV